jgi:hypothetical protein
MQFHPAIEKGLAPIVPAGLHGGVCTAGLSCRGTIALTARRLQI